MDTSQQTVISVPGIAVDQGRTHAAALHRSAERLAVEFDGSMLPYEIQALLDKEYARLAATARIKDFLPVFAERAARQHCRSAAARGTLSQVS